MLEHLRQLLYNEANKQHSRFTITQNHKTVIGITNKEVRA